MTLLVTWLLCSVAFAVWTVPTNPPNTPVATGLKILVSGVLIAIAICIVPGAVH